MKKNIEIAAYYFPNYHQDARNKKVHGAGWTEWELVKGAKPRFPGHQQPKVPLWGYTDEADPKCMAQKIDAAADNGLDAFIFDWYYYNDGPFIERGLEEGFLKAPNKDRMKFALMWANHDWVDIHPAQRSGCRLLYPGKVTPDTFEKITDYVIEKYFMDSSYWKINGCPYFSIYELFKFMQGYDGSVERTLDVLERFREKVKKAGFPDLHLNAVMWGVQILPGEQTIKNPVELAKKLKLDSIGSYVWVHHYNLDSFPVSSYEKAFKANRKFWEESRISYSIPYYPNVTMGWDSSPRTIQSDVFENTGYPACPLMPGTPAEFKKALESAVDFISEGKYEFNPHITINAWNEWTEGSYLEPDESDGYAYLNAIKEVKELIGKD